MRTLSFRSLFLGAALSVFIVSCDQQESEQGADPAQERTSMTQTSETLDKSTTSPGAVDVSNRTEIKRVISPGGIEAWLVEEHSVPMLAIEIGFKGGARRDPEGKEGLAYLLSGLLDEGAGDLDSQAFQTLLEDLAIRLSFDAGRDGFYGSVRTLTKNKEKAFDLLRLALTDPRFDEEPVERIRSQILVSLKRAEGNPRSISSKKWFEEVFKDHPYARQSKGTAESVSQVSADDLRAYVKSTLARSNLKIAVVGDIKAEELGPLLDKTFGDLPKEPERVAIEMAKVSEVGKLVVVEREQPQSIAVFGGPGLLMDDPDFFPSFVMNYILGGGSFASRLMEEVREKRGLAYGVSTQLVSLDYAGFLYGSVATENARVSESLNIIKSELSRMANEGVTDEELQNAKTYLTGSFPLRFDSNSSIANQLVGYQLTGRPIDYINTRNATIEAVTREDVARAAKRLLDPEKLTIVVIGKPEGLGQETPSSE